MLVWLFACGLDDGYGNMNLTLGGEEAPAVTSGVWYQRAETTAVVVVADFPDVCGTLSAYYEALDAAIAAEDDAAVTEASGLLPDTSWITTLAWSSAEDSFEGHYDMDTESGGTACRRSEGEVYPDSGDCVDILGGTLAVDRFDDPENTFTDGDVHAETSEGSSVYLTFHVPACPELDGRP